MAAQGVIGAVDRAGVVTALVRPVRSPDTADGVVPVRSLRTQRDSSARAVGVRSTRTGARFDPLLPFETWRDLGGRLGLYSNATAWWLGDWLAFGRMKYGRRYKEAIAATGLDYQTLRNYAVVARRFELSRRRDKLTFQHHAAVCALSDDEQDHWLDRAAAGGWSRNELRRRMRAGGEQPAEEIVRLAVGHPQAERWRRAAELSRCAFEAWMVRALDDAAGAPREASVEGRRRPVGQLGEPAPT